MKAQLQTYRELLADYDEVSTARELTFAEWLLLHSGVQRAAGARPFEHVLAQRFRTRVAEPAHG
jgi:hypothetical protein